MRSALGAAALTLACATAFASPADSVLLPDIDAGEHEIELAAGTDRDNGREHEDALTLSFGTGVTDWWATEVGVELAREHGEALRYDAIEWENRFGLLDDEEAPLALSMLVGFERPHEHDEGWSATLGLLSQKKLGRLQVNVNILAERTWAAAEAEENVTNLGYQWQLKYRHAPRFHYGLQGFGEVGKWRGRDASDEQEHSLGPAIFGRVPLGEGRRLKYDLGLLFGLTPATSDHTLRAKLEFEL
jgi:hypothetical protein